MAHSPRLQTAERYLWIGAALGALWEAPLSTPGWRTDPGKLLRLFKPFNLAMLILWCVWDGVLLLVRSAHPACGSLRARARRGPFKRVCICMRRALLTCLPGGLFLQVGWWLCQAGAAYLQHALSAPAQLAVHIAWGQLSSLAVEAIAAATGMWAYEPAGWNVSVLRLPNGKHLTVLPQAIWVVASTAFWTITLLL